MDLSRINLNLLVPLATLLRVQNVTHAARELHLSQSSMSATLARLREVLDDPLLVRSGRAMQLTPFAESLVEPLDEALLLVDRLFTQRPNFDPAIHGRTFTIAASDYSTLFLLRPLLECLHREAPNTSIDVRPLTDNSAELVQRNEIDLLVVSEQLATGDLAEFPRRPLLPDRFVLVGWRENPTVQDGMTLEDFRLLRFAQFVTGELPNLADRALDELGVVRQVEVRTTSQLLVPFLLTGTDLVALIPERLAVATGDVAQLRRADPPIPLPAITDSCLWHPSRSSDAGHRWLVERLSALAAGR